MKTSNLLVVSLLLIMVITYFLKEYKAIKKDRDTLKNVLKNSIASCGENYSHTSIIKETDDEGNEKLTRQMPNYAITENQFEKLIKIFPPVAPDLSEQRSV